MVDYIIGIDFRQEFSILYKILDEAFQLNENIITARQASSVGENLSNYGTTRVCRHIRELKILLIRWGFETTSKGVRKETDRRRP